LQRGGVLTADSGLDGRPGIGAHGGSRRRQRGRQCQRHTHSASIGGRLGYGAAMHGAVMDDRARGPRGRRRRLLPGGSGGERRLKGLRATGGTRESVARFPAGTAGRRADRCRADRCRADRCEHAAVSST
jgi:hypothetical protein